MLKFFGSSKLNAVHALYILFSLNLFNYLNRHFLAAVLVPIKNELFLTDTQLGHIAFVMMLSYTVSSLLFGFLADRFDRLNVVVFGVLIWAVSIIGVGFLNSYNSLLIMQVFIGIGQSAFTAAAPGFLFEFYNPDQRNKALTFFYIATPVGSALGFLAGGLLNAIVGWRLAFAIAGAPTLIMGLGLWFFFGRNTSSRSKLQNFV